MDLPAVNTRFSAGVAIHSDPQTTHRRPSRFLSMWKVHFCHKFMLLQSYRPEHVPPFGLEWIQLAVNNRVVAFLEHLTIFLLSTLEGSGSKLFFPDAEHRRPRGWCRHRGCFYRNRETAHLKLPKQLYGHYFQLAS